MGDIKMVVGISAGTLLIGKWRKNLEQSSRRKGCNAGGKRLDPILGIVHRRTAHRLNRVPPRKPKRVTPLLLHQNTRWPNSIHAPIVLEKKRFTTGGVLQP